MGLRNVTDVSMKIDTVAKCGWTTQPCAREDGTALLVQVEGSTVDCILDVAGARFGLGLCNWASVGVLNNFGLAMGLGPI